MSEPLRTPDGRYIVVDGVLWRASDPRLLPERRQALVDALMAARRDVGRAKGDKSAVAAARSRVDRAKRDLGERGPVWWDDGAPDLTRRAVMKTAYREWFVGLGGAGEG